MARGKGYDDKVKADAIVAMVGSSPEEVSKLTGIPARTLRDWQKLPVAQQMYSEQPGLADHIDRLLEVAVATCIELMTHARNPEWFRRQGAADIAVLFGVTTDKVIRILEAKERARQRYEKAQEE